MTSDFVYTASRDQIRVRIFRRDDKLWDFDVFTVHQGYVHTHTTYGAVSPFRTKKDAKEAASQEFGELRSIQVDNVTDGWHKPTTKTA